jgi:hypothetical protein
MSLVALSGNVSGTGTLTIASPNTNSNYTLTLPENSGTLISTASTFSTTGPAFSATPTTTQAVTSATFTKVTLGTENFDTNNNFASSRFTPTVAGYYQLNASLYPVSTNNALYIWALIYKNGTAYGYGTSAGPATGQDGVSVASTLVYMNGSTDYVELYCYVTGTSPVVQNGAATQFSGFLARAA